MVNQRSKKGYKMRITSPFAAFFSPNEHTLILPHPPHRLVNLVGDGVDVWREVPKLLLHVRLHDVQAVQAVNTLVGVHSRQDGADISLWGMTKGSKKCNKTKGKMQQNNRGETVTAVTT